MQNGKREEFPFKEKYTVEGVAKELGVSVEKVEKRLNNFFNSYLRHTRQYILSVFLHETGIRSRFILPNGIMSKKDFIEEYYRSREENNRPIFNIDFSKLPETISNEREKVTIIVNEFSQKGNYIGEVLVNYETFIKELKNPRLLLWVEKFKVTQEEKTKEFIRESEKRFPNCFSYEKTVWQGANKKLIITCLTCGKDFERTPIQHFKSTSGMCFDCAIKVAATKHDSVYTQEKFISSMIDKYGDILDFSNTKFEGMVDEFGNNRSVEATVIETGEIVRYQVKTLLYGNININHISRGERTIFKVLKDLNIEFEQQKSYKVTNDILPELIEIRDRVSVDFYFILNNKEYIVEYNGIQHYKNLGELFHNENKTKYLERIRRDKAVRNYCENNNIVLIEIPYTIGVGYGVIMNRLSRILINNEEISNVLPTIIPEHYEELQ